MAPSAYPSLSPELVAVRTTLSNLGSPDGQQESPASTYGGTMGTGSVPPTPQGANTQAFVTHISQSMHSMNINYSPLFHESRRSSPITVVDNQKHYESGHQKADNPNFLGRDTHENPFQENESDQFSTQHPTTPHRGRNSIHDTNVQNTPTRVASVRSGRSVYDLSLTPSRVKEPDRKDHISPGHDFEVVTADNAQALLPPRACVFVANLAQDRTDEELQASVTKAFQQYGNVYVKIRRDQRHMPFAFAQFENANHAHQALMQGKGLVIDGRPCRTEPSKANRSVYLSKLVGGPIKEQEARSALESFGVVEEIWLPSPTEREVYGLAEGIFVKFEYQQDRRKALAGMRDSITYHLEDPGVHSQNGRLTMTRRSRILMQSGQGGPDTPTRRPFRSGNVDRRSVTVTNISAATTYEELSARFVRYGMIMSIDSVNIPSIQGGPPCIFAIVEYGREDAAQEAISHENGTVLHGNTLRVERSDSMVQLRRRFHNINPYPRFPRFGPIGHLSHSQPNNGPHPFGLMRTPFHRGFNGYATGPAGPNGANAYPSPILSTPGSVFGPDSSASPNGIPLFPHFERGHQQFASNNSSPMGNTTRMAMHSGFQAIAQLPFPQPFSPYFPYPMQQHGMHAQPMVYMSPEFAHAGPQNIPQPVADGENQVETH